MCDEWMPTIPVPMNAEMFHRLPRHAAYHYAYLDGVAIISPAAKMLHATLDLANAQFVLPATEERCRLAGIEADDHAALARLFSDAFLRTQPFASLLDSERLDAARESLRRSFSGEDGPWVESASFLARESKTDKFLGAILITLIPGGDPSDSDTYTWSEIPDRSLGQPHLTWIFTHSQHKGEGIGTRLLAAAVARLRELGYTRLYTTFVAGNDSSMLWHWRNGFTLAPYFASRRNIRDRLKRT